MFNPKAKTRKLLAKARAAYVYKDGIVVWEERKARSGKLTTRLDVYHIFPCETPIRSSDYANESWGSGPLQGKAVSIGFHDPKLLLSGLDRVDVSYNSTSPRMVELGINCTSIHLWTANGMQIDINCFPFLSSKAWVSPDPLNNHYSSKPIASYTEFVERCEKEGEHVEIHEEW